MTPIDWQAMWTRWSVAVGLLVFSLGLIWFLHFGLGWEL